MSYVAVLAYTRAMKHLSLTVIAKNGGAGRHLKDKSILLFTLNLKAC